MKMENTLIIIAGLTKSGKTNISKKLASNLGCDYFEMSDPIMSRISKSPTIDNLLHEIHKFRSKNGKNILAKLAFEKIVKSTKPYSIVAGLRSKEDMKYLINKTLNNIIVFVHTNFETRLQKIQEDPLSIARNESDLSDLDMFAVDEGIKDVIRKSERIIINDDTFLITLDEQIEKLFYYINENYSLN